MRLHPDQLGALLAIVDGGTFEAAARALDVTASAVSQRIKALESEVGRVVVVRSTPCRPTATGEALVRLARQQRLLEAELAADLGDPGSTGGHVDLPVAVNADSLATWFVDVLREFAAWDGVALRLHVVDQALSAELLRSGQVLAAVTSDPLPVQGCSTQPLVTMRYHAAAEPGLRDRFATSRGTDWGAMPLVKFNAVDDLQQHVLDRHRVVAPPPTHEVPDTTGFQAAIRVGLGWGMLPPQQLDPLVETGQLVRLGSRDFVDVPLHWQRWRLPSRHLDRLTEVVLRAAARSGRPRARRPRR